MKRLFLKRAAAACLAMMIVSGGVPVMPLANQLHTITAAADYIPQYPIFTPPSRPINKMQYPIRVRVRGFGTVTANQSKAQEGQTVTLTITPDSGYRLSSLSVKGATVTQISDNQYSFQMPNTPVLCEAEFKRVSVSIVQHPINIGTMSNGTVRSTISKSSAGNTITLNVVPNAGYSLKSMTANNGAVSLTKVRDNVYSFTMPDSDVTVNAEFEHTLYSIMLPESLEYGSVSANRTNAYYGDPVTLTVTCNDGFGVSYVTADDAEVTQNEDGTYSFTMPAQNVTITAAFRDMNEYSHVLTLPENAEIVTDASDDKKFNGKYLSGAEVTFRLPEIAPEQLYVRTAVKANGTTLTPDADGNYTISITNENVTVKDFVKQLTKIEDKPATCAEEGWYEHYEDTDGDWYLMEDGNFKKTNVWNWIYIPKLYTHTFSQHEDTAHWEWKKLDGEYEATLYMVCDVCGEEQEVGHEYVSIGSGVVTKEPTETERGIKTYTATVTNNGKTYIGTYERVLPKIGGYVKIGNVNYNSLQEALDAAHNGQTITLYDDVDEPDGYYDGDNYISLTLDLNGHTANFGDLFFFYDLTIKNGIWNGKVGNWCGSNGKTLTLDNAMLSTPETEDEYDSSLSWSSNNIVLQNDSMLYLGGNAKFGTECESEDYFNLSMDATSAIILGANVSISSNYGTDMDALVQSAFLNYLPDGYSFSFDEENWVYHLVDADGNAVTEPILLVIPSYHVSVTDGKLSTGNTSEEIQASKLVTVKAGTVAGKTFSHWERNGKKISTNAAYSFYMPSEDVTLTAVFNETAVDPVGTAIIESVNANGSKLSFVSVLNVPKNGKFVKGGLVATQDAAVANTENYDAYTYKKLTTKATANTKNIKYTWTKSNATSAWYVRAYLVYKDASGTEHTVFGDVVSASCNS